MRDEARHIAEWATFHRDAGARHIYAYDNGSSDDSVNRVKEAVGDMVTVFPWNQSLRYKDRKLELHAQVLAYAHAASNFGGSYRWMAFVDTDEFLVPKQAGDLDSALAHLETQLNVSLPWHMFGRNGHMNPPEEGGVTRNYLRRFRDPMSDLRGIRNFKCIVDPCHLTGVAVHKMETDGSYATVNDRGKPATHGGRNRADFYSADHLQLNHYYTRSEAELAEKIGKGVFPAVKLDGHGLRVRKIATNIESDEVDDHSALDYLERRGLA